MTTAEPTSPGVPQRILSRVMFAALKDAGIVRDGDYVRRVVIDVQVGCAVVMHVERYGDERLLDVARTLSGIEIHCPVPEPEKISGEDPYREYRDAQAALDRAHQQYAHAQQEVERTERMAERAYAAWDASQ